jgi:hypothetical protein
MQVLGLYVDLPYMSLAVVEKKGKRGAVRSLLPMTLVTADNVKQFYMDQSVQHTSTAFSTLVRHLDFTISSPKQLAKILPFQVESLTAANAQEIVYQADFCSSKKGTKATVFLTSKENLERSLKEWKTCSFLPDQVTTTFAALTQFARGCIPELTSAFIIDLESQKTSCIWLEEGKLKKGFTIDQGIESLLAALWEDQKKVLFQKEVAEVASQMDLLQLKSAINPHLSQELDLLRNSLATVLYSFQKEAETKPVLFTGRIDPFIHLREYLLGPISEFSLYETSLSLEEQKCAMAIGCAFEQKIQFLKGEFTPKKVWQAAGGWALFLLSMSLLLTIFLSWGGHLKFQSEKEEIAHSFKDILMKTDKKFANTLFLENIEEGIEEAALAIQKYDKETPYILQTANVTEVLAWISAHPLVKALEKTDDPLKILSVKYELVSFPHIESMREKYRAKVDLEFSVKSPMSARKFHESLLAGDSLVNAQEELTWDSSDDTYRTSFFLQNKR